VITVKDTDHDFGITSLRDTIEWKFTIYNYGISDLVLSDLANDNSGFSVNDIQLPLTLSPSDSTTCIVRFSPSGFASYSDTLRIVSNDIINPTLKIGLKGIAISDTIPRLYFSERSHDFGQVRLNSQSSNYWQIIINNIGKVALNIQNITTDNPVFTLPDQVSLPQIIQPDSQLTIIMVFDPVEVKQYSGKLMVASDDPINPMFSVTLIGEGIQNTNLSSNQDDIIKEYRLYSNYPNPFNPITWIKYSVKKPEKVSLIIFFISTKLPICIL
jgi:hypothetical protein